jgi:hypothetical protein
MTEELSNFDTCSGELGTDDIPALLKCISDASENVSSFFKCLVMTGAWHFGWCSPIVVVVVSVMAATDPFIIHCTIPVTQIIFRFLIGGCQKYNSIRLLSKLLEMWLLESIAST